MTGTGNCTYTACGPGTDFEFNSQTNWTINCQRFKTECNNDGF
jgi:hypothetical protein